MAVCRELTKLHEEIFRGTVSQALEHFDTPRGEFALVIAGCREPDKPELTEEVKQRLENMKQAGMKAKEATADLATETGLSRKELYRTWLKLT